MKKPICVLALSWISVYASGNDIMADPESWYRDADGRITHIDKSTW